MIEGHWFPAGSSKQVPASLRVSGEQYFLKIADQPERSGQLGQINVSSRIGSIPRTLTLPDQSIFETLDNDAVDAMLAVHKGGSREGSLIHRMESRWHWIGVALIVVIVAVYSTFRWGLPWTSEVVAQQLPRGVLDSVSESSLDFLDGLMFQPSSLPKPVQDELREAFHTNVSIHGEGGYKLHFRGMSGLPNALALPSGDLVVTDAFARMATNDEFVSVMLHEIGHVEQRHGMQQLVRSSIISFVVAMIFGDPSGMEELIIGLPLFVMQSRYSREHESEADTFAFEKMIEAGIDPIHFANIMQKMEDAVSIDIKPRGEIEEVDPATEEQSAPDLTDYLSSHPATSERIERAREYSERFNSGS